jgi:hypothetical protein
VLIVDPRSIANILDYRMAHAGGCAGHGPLPTIGEESVHDLLDTLKQCVEPNAATNLRFRTTYQN